MFTQVTRTLCLALPGSCLAKDRKQSVDLIDIDFLLLVLVDETLSLILSLPEPSLSSLCSETMPL